MDTKYISEVIHPTAISTDVNEWTQINFNFNENDGIRYLIMFSTPFIVDIRAVAPNNSNMASNGRRFVSSLVTLNEQVTNITVPPLVTTTIVGVGLLNASTTFHVRCDRLNNRILIRRESFTNNPNCTMLFTFNEIVTT
jgi:hypothetical protein